MRCVVGVLCITSPKLQRGKAFPRWRFGLVFLEMTYRYFPAKLISFSQDGGIGR